MSATLAEHIRALAEQVRDTSESQQKLKARDVSRIHQKNFTGLYLDNLINLREKETENGTVYSFQILEAECFHKEDRELIRVLMEFGEDGFSKLYFAPDKYPPEFIEIINTLMDGFINKTVWHMFRDEIEKKNWKDSKTRALAGTIIVYVDGAFKMLDYLVNCMYRPIMAQSAASIPSCVMPRVFSNIIAKYIYPDREGSEYACAMLGGWDVKPRPVELLAADVMAMYPNLF